MNWNRFNPPRPEWWERYDWGRIYRGAVWACIVLAWSLLVAWIAKGCPV